MKRMSGLFKQVVVFGALFSLLSIGFSTVSWAAQSAPRTEESSMQKVTRTVNVNTADINELITLPGIGQKTAEKIIAQRQSSGPFKTTGDLLKVKGIGEKNLKKIADLISFE